MLLVKYFKWCWNLDREEEEEEEDEGSDVEECQLFSTRVEKD